MVPNVTAKLVSITGCLSFPSQCPTVIHFDNCHTANQVVWKSIITGWLLHQPGWVGDGFASAGSWSPTSYVSLLTYAKLGTHSLAQLHQKGVPLNGILCLSTVISDTDFYLLLLKIMTPSPFPSFQISFSWQIKEELLADKRKTYLLNNSPD